MITGFRILVVDDDREFRLFMTETLSDAGFEVVEAVNGVEAINILNRLDKLDILITDIQMPGLADGNDVAAQAKVLYPDLPVVYVSGSPESLINTLDLNDIYLDKPFRSAWMLSEVRRLLHLTEIAA